ncbi:MAG: WcbI family polysaccharide biosynthesis putative acetyltransferase [Cyanobacteriota bacterium]
MAGPSDGSLPDQTTQKPTRHPPLDLRRSVNVCFVLAGLGAPNTDLSMAYARKNLQICLAGNCQVETISAWLQLNLPSASIQTLPPYHLLTSDKEVEDWLHCCDSADLVLAMPVKTGYRNLAAMGSDHFKQRIGQRLHFFPNLHSDAFFPFFGYAKNQDGATLTHAQYPANPHGDYHDFLAMAIADSKIKWGRIQRFRLRLAANVQTSLIAENARSSISELRRRIVEMKSPLQYEQISLDCFCGYTFNHPSVKLLNLLYSSLWATILKGPPEEFRPLQYEPFASGTVLPTIDFVFKALHRIDPSLERATLSRPVESFASYEETLKKAMNVYAGDDSVVRMNRQHPKFKAAKTFLRFYRI